MKPKILKQQITNTGQLSCEGQFKLSKGSIVHFSIHGKYLNRTKHGNYYGRHDG